MLIEQRESSVLKTRILISFFGLLFLVVSYKCYSQNDVNKTIYFILRIDDYGIDNANIYEPLIEIITKHNCALTIGVVPYKKKNNSYLPIADSLLHKLSVYTKKNTRIEVALHGYSHENNMTSGGSSEFIALDENVQLQKIKDGKGLLESKLKIKIKTFIPPWNNFDANTTKALSAADFIGVSASTYGLSGRKEIDKKLKYLPYSVSLSKLIGNKNLSEDLQKLPDNSIVVALFHGYDFVEDKSIISSVRKKNYLKSNQIRLADLDNFLRMLHNTGIVKFCSFDQLYTMKKVDLSSERFLNSSINIITTSIWPVVSLESLSYLDNNKKNWINIYYMTWPFTFYTLIFFSGILFATTLIKRLIYNFLVNKMIILGVFALSIMMVLYFRDSIKYLILFFFWIGCVTGLLRITYLVFLTSSKTKFHRALPDK